MVQLKSAAMPFFYTSGSIGLRKLVSYNSIPCTKDPFDEFHVKMTVIKFKNHLQNITKSSRILQKCFRTYRQNLANAVNLCAALKTEHLFSLVSYANIKIY